MNNNVTIVTGLWDLGRGDLGGWAKRDFSYYKERFFEMLKSDVNMIIWIPSELEDEVRLIRKPENTKIHIKEVEDFKVWFPFFDKLQEIRTNPNWYNLAGWLAESPQASLKFYNPMMMCKMFMLNDSAIYDTFSTDYFFWIDGGLTNTVNKGYFLNDNVLDNLDYYCNVNDDKFIHLSYPYEGNEEIHGFERKKMAEYCGTDFVRYVARGGFFGGLKSKVNQMNNLYYSVLNSTINAGYMGADECLFTILCHTHSDMIHRFELEGNGLCWPFFEELKNIRETTPLKSNGKKPMVNVKTSLYVLTYNSPNQFETLIKSFEEVEPNFLKKTRKILLNNSTNRETDEQYSQLCEKYDFEEIKKDNIGICGGRQLISEHFDESDSDYYIFFEDDMFLHPNTKDICSSGFLRYKENLYDKTLKIINENEYDFLKLSFTEFYGDNSVQWSWYNVPQDVRNKFFPNKRKLPAQGHDPNAPKTEYKHIKMSDDITFIEGQVHYCNWPIWISREGNKKIFIDTKWGHPFEQTWMSHVFQNQMENKIKAAVLLLSPIKHDRFDFYPGGERREN